MEYRNWNDKPLRTSLLGYGCMRFPTRADGSIDEPRAEALLNAAENRIEKIRLDRAGKPQGVEPLDGE